MSRITNYLLLLIVTVLASTSSADAAPSQQARYVSFSKVQSNQMRVSWINGNGGNRMVIMGLASNWSSTITDAITDGTVYSANSSYGTGDDIGSFEVVYNGSGRTRYVDVTGLSGSTSYTIAVIEYNYQGGQTSYNVGSAANNPRSKQTPVAAPTGLEVPSDYINATNASATWSSSGTEDGFIVQLYDLTNGEFHFDYDEADIGDPISGSSETFTFDYLENNNEYSLRVRSYTGNEESGWAGELFGASATSFTTDNDGTPPSFTVEYFSDNNLTTSLGASPTISSGTYYLEIVSSEPLDQNPQVFIDVNTGSGAGSTFSDDINDVFEDSPANVLAYSSTTFVYTREISSATYADGVTGEVSETINIGGTDYANNSATVTPTHNNTAIFPDNTPPAIASIHLESGTFGISNTISATIVSDATNYSNSSITFNGVELTANDIYRIGSSVSYTTSYTVVEGNNNVSGLANLTSTSFNLTDPAGNSSTWFSDMTSATLNGASSDFIIDAQSPTITVAYLPSGNYAVGNTISTTFATTNSNPLATFNFASSSFNSASISNFQAFGSNSFSVDYIVVEGENDVTDYTSELQFTFSIADNAGNNSDLFWETSISSVTITGGADFTIDANSPSITDVTYPSGTFGIDDVVSVTITATESSLSFNSASINNTNSVAYDNGYNTNYIIDYTIVEGHTDRLTGNASSIPGTFTLSDANGNISNTFISNADDTGVYIDATRPSVTLTAIAPGAGDEYGIGDVLTLLISSDGSNYTASSATIQGNVVSTTYLNNGSETYNLSYTVTSGDGEHYADLSSFNVYASITDNAGNISNTFQDPVTQNGGDVYIDGESASITNIWVESGTFIVGDVVQATFTTDDDNYTSHTASFAGNTVSGFDNIGSNSYTTTFTVGEGSTSADGLASLSFSMYTSDTFGNQSSEYTGFNISAALEDSGGSGTFILDGTSPTISSISITSGTYKVGDSVGIIVTTALDDSGPLTYTSASFNDQDITDFTVTSNTSYSFTYQVQSGDTQRSTKAQVPVDFTLQDRYGNNTQYTTSQADFTANILEIDGIVPSITSVALQPNASGYGIGDEIEVRVTISDLSALGDVFSLETGNVNNVTVTNYGYNSGGYIYSSTYTVQEGDTDRNSVSSIPVSFSVYDRVQNQSTTYSAAPTTIGGAGVVYIDANSASITDLTFASGNYKVGDVISATFTADADNYLNSAHTFSINGTDLVSGNFSNYGSNSYTASFTVVEGDDDIANLASLTFDVSTSDTFGNNSVVYSEGDIIAVTNDAGAFSIDGNSPTVTAVEFTSGNYKIGDFVSLTITSQETGLSLDYASVNGQTITDFTDYGDNNYGGTYTVQNGDTDLDNLAALATTTSFSLMDANGNMSNTFTTGITASNGTISIDGSLPVVNSVALLDGNHKVGDYLSATISTDGVDIYTSSSITINGVNVSGFAQIAASSSYSTTYTVQEGDADRTGVGTIPITVEISDPNGNISNVYNAPATARNGGAVNIDANTPTISAITLASGTYNTTTNSDMSATITTSEGGLTSVTFSINDVLLADPFVLNTDFHDIGSGSYTTTYTVSEGDSDAASVNDIAISLYVSDSFGNKSTEFTSNATVTPGGDVVILDANSPTITVVTVESGTYGIGDEISATITEDQSETGLVLIPGSTSFNGQGVSNFTDYGNGDYGVTYTVQSGDNDVSNLSGLSASFQLRDIYQNTSNIFNDDENSLSESGGSLYIDANAPTIAEVIIPAGNYGVGSYIAATITTDETNMSLSSISFNGETLGFSALEELGSNSYSVTWTVQDQHPDYTKDIDSGENSIVKLLMTDAGGNESNTFSANATNNGLVNIDATKPQIYAITMPSGSYGIGDHVSATIETDAGLFPYYNTNTITLNSVLATDFTQLASTTYTATITLADGQTSVFDAANISTSAYVGSSTFGHTSNEFTTSSTVTGGGNITLDVDRPTIASYEFNPGLYGIGTTVTATFTAGNNEQGLTVSSASINGVDVSANFTELGGGEYELYYVVSEGDGDVSSAALASASLTVLDNVGNSSTTTLAPTSASSFAIDATRPIISDVYLESSSEQSSGTFIIGDQVDVTVVSETNLQIGTGTFTVNGNTLTSHANPGASNSYTSIYTVVEGDTDRGNIASTPIEIAVVDQAGNASTLSTSASGSDPFAIDANRPGFLVYYTDQSDLTSPRPATFTLALNNTYYLAVRSNEMLQPYSASDPSITITIDSEGATNDVSPTESSDLFGTYPFFHYNNEDVNTAVFLYRRNISGNGDADGNDPETITISAVDLAGNTFTGSPSYTNLTVEQENFYYYIDNTPASFTMMYYTDNSYSTTFGDDVRLKEGSYGLEFNLSELVKPSATLTIVSEDGSNDVTGQILNVPGINTTSFSFTRAIGNTFVDGNESETYSLRTSDDQDNIATFEVVSNAVDTRAPGYDIIVEGYNPADRDDTEMLVNFDNTSLTVTLEYDEDMDTAVNPSITFSNVPQLVQNSAAWNGSRSYTLAYTHDGTNEEMPICTVSVTSQAQDIAGNLDSLMSNDYEIEVDLVRPTATISISSGTINTNTQYQVVSVGFDEAMDTDYDPSVSVSGGGYTLSNTAWPNDHIYSATYSYDPNIASATSTATITTAPSGARDSNENTDLIGSPSSETYTIDTRRPVQYASFNISNVNLATTSGTYFVWYDEDVNQAANPSVSTTNGGNITPGAGQWISSSNTFYVPFTHSGTETTTFTIEVDNNITDLLGNTDDTGNTITLPIDTEAPNVTVNVDPQSNSTTMSSLSFNIIFDEDVTGLTVGEVSYDAGVTGANSLSLISVNSRTYVAVVSGMTSSGNVSATIGAGVAQDGVGNNSLAATSSDNTASYTYVTGYSLVTFYDDGVSSTVSPNSNSNVAFKFSIDDDNYLDDTRDTKLDYIILNRPSGSYDYNAILNDIELQTSGGSPISTGSIGTSSITFSGINQSIADDGSATYIVEYDLESSLPTGSDNLEIEFEFDHNDIGLNANSSRIESIGNSTTTFTGDNNKIIIDATKLIFSTQPSSSYTVGQNVSTTISSTDSYNNVDSDISNTVTISSNGSLSSGDYVVLSNGNGSLVSVFDTPKGYANLQTSNSEGLTNATSNTFHVVGVAPSTVNNVFVTRGYSNLTINWEMNNGGEDHPVLILMKRISNATYGLTDENNLDGNVYSGSSVFGSGDQDPDDASGYFVLSGEGANGGGDKRYINVTNLQSGSKVYSMAIYSYSGDESVPATVNYNETQFTVRQRTYKTSIDGTDDDFIDMDRLVSMSDITPNPVKNEMNFDIYLNNELPVTIDIIDAAGNKIATLFDNAIFSSETIHPINVTMVNMNIAQGAYILRISAGDESVSKQFIYMP